MRLVRSQLAVSAADLFCQFQSEHRLIILVLYRGAYIKVLRQLYLNILPQNVSCRATTPLGGGCLLNVLEIVWISQL